jgi:hypothetical protein
MVYGLVVYVAIAYFESSRVYVLVIMSGGALGLYLGS